MPIHPDDMEDLTSTVFQPDGACLMSDIDVLFRTGKGTPHRACRILVNTIDSGPPPYGTEASFHYFWDLNIRNQLELLLPRGRTVRDTSECTATGNLRPDYGFLLNKLCVFRGEEKPPGSREDPKIELSKKLAWAYDPAPYVLGYYITGSDVTLVAISPPRRPGGDPIVHDIAKADLRLKKDRILNIRRLINLSPICKILSDMVRPAESEFEKLERQYCTVEIAGHRIVKEFTTPDSRERLDRLCRVYNLLKEKEVPHTDWLVHHKEPATAVLAPRGITRLPQTEDELISALICVLECLQFLHKEPTLFHRDIRWPNVINDLDNKDQWFIIDWDDAACPPTKAASHFNRKGHSPNIFADGHGADVDIWGVGELINSCRILSLSPKLLDLGKCMQSADAPTVGDALARVMEFRSSHSS